MKEPKHYEPEHTPEKEEPKAHTKELDYAGFRALFTEPEFNAVLSNSAGLDWLLQIIAHGGKISLSDKLITDNLPHVSGSVLTGPRRKQILAGEPPQPAGAPHADQDHHNGTN